MDALERLVVAGRTLRAVGFDDGPRAADGRVPLAGVVTRGTRFEGMVWTQVAFDGSDATAALIGAVSDSKFASQVHLVLTDGITVAGLNVLDLPGIHRALGVPVIAVMRRQPELDAFRRAVRAVDPGRLALVDAAGPIHTGDFVFQCVGCPPEVAAKALALLTDTGQVPEPLRLAHMIAAAVVTGQSGKRA